MSVPTSPTCIAFAHANSYPAASYAPLLDLLRADREVIAFPKLGHDPRFPVTHRWPHLVAQYRQWLEQQGRGPYLLVGHSLGGYLSLMVAEQAPELAAGVILLDSPIIGGWKALLLGSVQRTPLVWKFSPARFAKVRRNHFPSLDEAFAHYRSKGVFKDFSDDALWHYVRAGTEPVPGATDGSLRLAFDRMEEARIYNGLPDHIPGVLKRLKSKRPDLPLALLYGTRSAEAKTVGLVHSRRFIAADRIIPVEGTHLFPLERPEETAALIAALLANAGLPGCLSG
jgi:pimeloyl-ACP methyl ester carboxylesterase